MSKFDYINKALSEFTKKDKEEWQYRASAKMLGDTRNKGKVRTEEQKAANGARKKGTKLTKEHRDKIRNTLLENNFTPSKEQIEKASRAKFKPVQALNIVTKSTYNFNNIKEAAKVLNLKSGNISSVLRGNQNSTEGYMFKYADDCTCDLFERLSSLDLIKDSSGKSKIWKNKKQHYKNTLDSLNKRSITIQAFKDGNSAGIFKSISEAGRKLDLNTGSISLCLKNPTWACKGYTFKKI